MNSIVRIIIVLCMLATTAQGTYASDINNIYPTAIFDFIEKSRHMSGLGEKVGNVVFATLATNPTITLVDREEMNKLRDEAELNLSGMVNPLQANQIGMLTGAKIIVTGNVFEIEDTLFIVAKIIGTETSRVFGVSVKGNTNSSIVALTEELAEKIATSISENGAHLVAKQESKVNRITKLKELLGSKSKPSLSISISERHVNRATIDPAAEIEMMLYSIESGFEVIDSASKKRKQADILIIGEGFSEFASRKDNIIGVRARLEVKAIDRVTKKVIAVDRQTVIELGLSEIATGKKALERASGMIAERLLPKIVNHKQ